MHAMRVQRSSILHKLVHYSFFDKIENQNMFVNFNEVIHESVCSGNTAHANDFIEIGTNYIEHLHIEMIEINFMNIITHTYVGRRNNQSQYVFEVK